MNLPSPETARPWLELFRPSNGEISATVFLVFASMTQMPFFVFVAPQAVLVFEKKYRSPGCGLRTAFPVAGFRSETITPRREDQSVASRFGPPAGAGRPGAGEPAGALPAMGALDCWTVVGSLGAGDAVPCGALHANVTSAATPSRVIPRESARWIAMWCALPFIT